MLKPLIYIHKYRTCFTITSFRASSYEYFSQQKYEYQKTSNLQIAKELEKQGERDEDKDVGEENIEGRPY